MVSEHTKEDVSGCPPGHSPHTRTMSLSSTSDPVVANQKIKRAFRACVHCRIRKAKCDLGDVDSPKDPPCARCKREGQQCVFAPSRRGGRRNKNHDSPAIANDIASGTTGPPPSKRPRVDYDEEEEEDGSPFLTEAVPAGLAGHSSVRHLSLNHSVPLVGPEQLAAASLRNPEDAVNLLVLASEAAQQQHQQTHSDVNEKTLGSSNTNSGDPSTDSTSSPHPPPPGSVEPPFIHRMRLSTTSLSVPHDSHSPVSSTSTPALSTDFTPPTLESFPLVARGFLNPDQLCTVVSFFFRKMHFFFPMVPVWRQPKTPVQLSQWLADEPDLGIIIVVIASRYISDEEPEGDWRKIHQNSWEIVRKRLSDLMLGKEPTLGMIEGLLLLSEYLPRLESASTNLEVQEEEKRMTWMFVGTAVRLGYLLGLDQKTFISVPSGMSKKDEKLHRERLVWTYCYMFDRQVSIRMGKAFWSRGPGLCFQQSSISASFSATSSSYINFPSLGGFDGGDYACLVQAYVELTQTMTSAHDILYPSKDRTIALVRVGDYYKYLDEFTRSINGFRMNWETKKWDEKIMGDCVWIYFHYLRLYISSFAFQAHVQRAMPGGIEEMGGSRPRHQKKSFESIIFPRGVTGSPDAKFILEGIDAASHLVKMCTERFSENGRLSCLPWRFFLFFSYAAVFLVKALFVGAVVPFDQKDTIQLLKKLIACLASSSGDDEHPGVRYAHHLNAMLKTFSRGVDYVGESLSHSLNGDETPPPAIRPSSARNQSQDGWLQPPPQSSTQISPMPHPPSSLAPFALDACVTRPPVSTTTEISQGSPETVFDIFSLSTGTQSTMHPPPPIPAEGSWLFSDNEAIDSDFWRSLGTQPGDWDWSTGFPRPVGGNTKGLWVVGSNSRRSDSGA